MDNTYYSTLYLPDCFQKQHLQLLFLVEDMTEDLIAFQI